MKKILCLMLSVLVLFAFAACGNSENGSSDNASTESKSGSVSATSIKFDAESYMVEVDDYIMLSDHITVEPAGATVKYSCSDETVAEIASPSKGEFMGLKTGEVTVTAASEDGTVTATCKLIVAGMGTVVARKDNEGGITNKRWGAVERPDDANALVLIISKNIADGTDMSKAVALDCGEKGADGSCVASYNGFYVAKTGDTGNYNLEKIPEGEYVGLIVSSMDYTSHKTYNVNTAVSALKASALSKYFTDAEINKLADSIYNREFYVGELTVTAKETTVFGYDFQPDVQ